MTTTTQHAIIQLQRSERGIRTCQLLYTFLNSPTVAGLDASNSFAAATLLTSYLLGTSAQACEVLDELAAFRQIEQDS